jgi:hypothetical protein
LDQADPYKTQEKLLASDPTRDELEAVLEQWKLRLGVNSRATVHALVAATVNDPTFYSALLTVGGGDNSGRIINNKRLGWWLRQIQGKIVNGLMIKPNGKKDGAAVWQLYKQ